MLHSRLFHRCLWRTLLTGLAMASALSLSKAVQARDYVVSPHGSDTNPGTAAQPWQTLAKVNATALKPGDRVLLTSGATFTGNLTLTDQEAGTPTQPISITSTGKGRAVIVAAGQTAISAAGGGITIRNLTLKGTATKADKSAGIAFFTDNATGGPFRKVILDNLEISGFGDDGISMGTGDHVKTGYSDVRITHVSVHDNFGTGIITYNKIGAKAAYALTNFSIADCLMSRNHGGTGMVLSGINHGIVEFCRAVGNIGKGGGVGIWAYAAKDVTFRNCIASGTKTGGGDGGGFDLDGACVSCKVISCLTYGNDGPGYMHCDYPSATPTQDNVISGSISVNDGRKLQGGPYGFGFCVWGSGLDDCIIQNNLTLVTQSDPEARHNGVYWVAYIPESAGDAKYDLNSQHLTGCVFRDNTAYVAGTGAAFVDNDFPKSTLANVKFDANLFRTAPSVSAIYVQDKKHYATEHQWRQATEQTLKSTPPSAPTLPKLTPAMAASLSQITDPHKLPKLTIMQALSRGK